MKTNHLRAMITITAIAPLLLASSGKNHNPMPTNFFIVNGATKTIKGASFLYNDQLVATSNGNTYYENYLALFTEGVTMQNGKPIAIKGDFILFNLYGASTQLDVGSYTLNNDHGKDNIRAYQMYGLAVLGADSEAKTSSWSEFTAVHLEISKSADTYTIKATDALGDTVLAYVGAVPRNAEK